MDNFNVLLDKCNDLNDRIKKVDENILIIRNVICSPRNQVINGMPRGGGGQSIEDYIIKIEKLEKRKKRLNEEKLRYWNQVVSIMFKNQISKDDMMIFKYRYFLGFKWEQVAENMQKYFTNGNWNENKCYRVHRIVLSKIHNNGM